MKKIDPNVASKLMDKELKEHDFQKKFQAIDDDLARVGAHIRVLNGYLSSDFAGDGNGDSIYPFVDELENQTKQTRKAVQDLIKGLWDAGRIRSHFEGFGDKMVWVKCTTTVERIPTTYYQEEKKEEKNRKAA